MLSSCTHSSGALDALTPVLNDFQRRYLHAPPTLRPYITQAMIAMEEKLAPVSPDRLEQIIGHLLAHYPGDSNAPPHRAEAYRTVLRLYPEDLLCAAYENAFRHHLYQDIPPVTYFLSFMEPEMERRKSIYRKLEMLCHHMEETDDTHSSSSDDVTLATRRGTAALGSASDTDSKANRYE